MTYFPGCTGKVRFATRAVAEKAATKHPDPQWTAAGERRRPLYPYECEFCGCWHNSHLTPAEAERSKARAKERRAANAELVQRLLKERGLR